MISRSPGPGPTGLTVPESVAPPPAGRWQRSLADAVRSLGELLDLLQLAPERLAGAAAASRDFPVRVPRGFVARIRPKDPRDPLLLQVLPTADELAAATGWVADPLAEDRASPVPGLLHKYRGRVLLLAAGACAVHCRYCFRRHFPYGEHALRPSGWRAALDYVAAETTVREVILSGGDPLAATDDQLAALAAELAAVPHLERLRVHTRMPIVLPERVDDRLLAWLSRSRLAPVVVVHANHPREIDGAVRAALQRLRDAGVTVLNQSVLLAGVNDDAGALERLSEALFSAGALPYYLHLLDRVRGVAHFEVDETRAKRLVRELTARLPGYLVPRLVREVPGAPAKLPICPAGGS